jgi:hypothetical protein
MISAVLDGLRQITDEGFVAGTGLAIGGGCSVPAARGAVTELFTASVSLRLWQSARAGSYVLGNSLRFEAPLVTIPAATMVCVSDSCSNSYLKTGFLLFQRAGCSRKLSRGRCCPTCCNQSEALPGDQRLLLVYVPPFRSLESPDAATFM